MPAASASMPSSLAEQSMPKDSTPRTVACRISSSGSLAPTRAQAVLSPARALGAPQTMASGALLPHAHAAHLQPVGVGMPLGGKDLGHHHALEGRRNRL
jgi:hypothetical protein